MTSEHLLGHHSGKRAPDNRASLFRTILVFSLHRPPLTTCPPGKRDLGVFYLIVFHQDAFEGH